MTSFKIFFYVLNETHFFPGMEEVPKITLRNGILKKYEGVLKTKVEQSEESIGYFFSFLMQPVLILQCNGGVEISSNLPPDYQRRFNHLVGCN